MNIMLSKIYGWAGALCTHLWLSVSSASFYQRVMLSYYGYGIRYSLTLSFISSLLWCMFILNQLDNVRQYFSYGTLSPQVANLDHIISQLPEIKYNGREISLESAEPVYINDIDNQVVIAIDPENMIPLTERIKLPILFLKKKILLSFTNLQDSSINAEYPQVFGLEDLTLTQETVKSLLKNFCDKLIPIFIYITFPLLGFLIFFHNFLEKSFIIIITYFITYFMNTKSSLQSCVRLTMFTSGPFILLYPIVISIAPEYLSLVWAIQIWANLLMAVGIIKLSHQDFFKFK